MNKVVNIYPSMAILGVNPPIRTTQTKVTKSTSEIRACIIARAMVDEILPNGKTIRLNLNNYNKDNIALYCKSEPKATPAVIKNAPIKDARVDAKQEVAKAPIDTVPSTEKPEKETVEVEQSQFMKRKKNKKNRHANRDTDRVVGSTNTSEESVVEAEVSADATDTESTETVDVEALS